MIVQPTRVVVVVALRTGGDSAQTRGGPAVRVAFRGGGGGGEGGRLGQSEAERPHGSFQRLRRQRRVGGDGRANVHSRSHTTPSPHTHTRN